MSERKCVSQIKQDNIYLKKQIKIIKIEPLTNSTSNLNYFYNQWHDKKLKSLTELVKFKIANMQNVWMEMRQPNQKKYYLQNLSLIKSLFVFTNVNETSTKWIRDEVEEQVELKWSFLKSEVLKLKCFVDLDIFLEWYY